MYPETISVVPWRQRSDPPLNSAGEIMADPNPKTHLDIQQLIIIVKFHARQFILQARDIESKTDYFASGDNDGANVDFLKEILTKIAESYPNDPFSLCIRDGRDIVRDAACAAAAEQGV